MRSTVTISFVLFIQGYVVLKGSVIVGDDTIAQEAFHTIVLSAEPNETGVKLTAAEDGTEFVLVSSRTSFVGLFSNANPHPADSRGTS